MAAFSVYDQTFLDSDHEFLDIIPEINGLFGLDFLAQPTEPLSMGVPTCSNIHADSLHIVESSKNMGVYGRKSMESSLGSQNTVSNPVIIKAENPSTFYSPSLVVDHIHKKFSSSLDKSTGSNTHQSYRVLDSKPSEHKMHMPLVEKVVSKNDQHGSRSDVLNATVQDSTNKVLEEDKCKRLRSGRTSRDTQRGSNPIKLDANKKSRAELSSKIVKDEALKDYIHVRARRGEATDSHSLAERVRREKIRERMKRLQELVPGCSKVTGKAQILDEIINYIHSLQNQVEFLSFKLASAIHQCNSHHEIEGRACQKIPQLQGNAKTLTSYVEQRETAAQPQMPGTSFE